MLKRLLVIALVLGGLWGLLFGLSDRQIDTFQAHRRTFVSRLQTIRHTLTSTWGKV